MTCDYVSLNDGIDLPRIASQQPASPAIQNWGNSIQGYHFRYVRGTEIARWKSVSKQWRSALNSEAQAYIWKEVFHSDFCLPESPPQQKSFQVLYKEKVCTHLNIKNKQRMYLPISMDSGSSAILVKDYFVQTDYRQISVHRIIPYRLERAISRFPSSASPNFLEGKRMGTMDRSLDNHFVGHNIALFRAGQDLFFSRSQANKSPTVCLWEASTGNCLFANDNLSSNLNDDLQLVNERVIYTTDKQQWTESNDKICEVQIWDYKSQQLIGSFNLPDVYASCYRHHLSEKVLVSECGKRIIGHHLETHEKLYDFSHHTHMQMVIRDKWLLIYRQGATKIEIYDIKDGALILELQSGFLAIPNNSKNFQCHKNYCFVRHNDDFGLQVWDLDKGVRIQDLKPVFPTDQVNLAGPFIIHHDRLIVHYAYQHQGSIQGHLAVWNLKDFSVLISAGCEVGSLNFMDDHLLALDVSNPEKGLMRILFWDILKGKFLGFTNKKLSSNRNPYQIDFLNGKMFIKNQWIHTTHYSNRTETTRGGGIYDFSVDIKPIPTLGQLGQAIMKAVQSVFCS